MPDEKPKILPEGTKVWHVENDLGDPIVLELEIFRHHVTAGGYIQYVFVGTNLLLWSHEVFENKTDAYMHKGAVEQAFENPHSFLKTWRTGCEAQQGVDVAKLFPIDEQEKDND